MEKSRQQRMKELTIEFLKMDGNIKSIDEIRNYLSQNGFYTSKKRSELRTALCFLKSECKFVKNPERGFYVWEEDELEKQADKLEKRKNQFEQQKKIEDMDDFSDFDIICSSTKRNAKLVASIQTDGTFALNMPLLKLFVENKAEVKLRRDGSELLLKANESTKFITFGKNGKTKNYDLLDKLENLSIKLPVYYVGEWNESSQIWRGNISSINPNKVKKSKK